MSAYIVNDGEVVCVQIQIDGGIAYDFGYVIGSKDEKVLVRAFSDDILECDPDNIIVGYNDCYEEQEEVEDPMEDEDETLAWEVWTEDLVSAPLPLPLPPPIISPICKEYLRSRDVESALGMLPGYANSETSVDKAEIISKLLHIVNHYAPLTETTPAVEYIISLFLLFSYLKKQNENGQCEKFQFFFMKQIEAHRHIYDTCGIDEILDMTGTGF